MPYSPENNERLKKVALAGATLALASIALKHNKIIGQKIRHASFWEASQSVLIDIVDEGKQKMMRLAGTVIRNERGEAVDVDIEDFNYSEAEIAELEEAFSDSQPEKDSDQSLYKTGDFNL